MKFENERKFYEIWLYYLNKGKWNEIYDIYKFLIEYDISFYINFKKYVDIYSQEDRFGNILNHEYLFQMLPFYYKEKLLELFYEASKLVKNKFIHIVSDIDDTILKSYYLPNHDFSMKIYKYPHNVYPYLYNFYINSFQDPLSTKYITFCTLRSSFLYKYTKDMLANEFQNSLPNHLIVSDNFIFMYYAIDFLFNYNVRPFTNEWLEKYFYAGITKFNKINLFSDIFPEYNLYFFGDTGEGDMITATLLLLNQKIKYAFLNDILSYENLSNENSQCSKECGSYAKSNVKSKGKSYVPENLSIQILKLGMEFSFLRKKNKIYCEILRDKRLFKTEIYLFQNFDKNSIEKIFSQILN